MDSFPLEGEHYYISSSTFSYYTQSQKKRSRLYLTMLSSRWFMEHRQSAILSRACSQNLYQTINRCLKSVIVYCSCSAMQYYMIMENATKCHRSHMLPVQGCDFVDIITTRCIHITMTVFSQVNDEISSFFSFLSTIIHYIQCIKLVCSW